MSDSEKTILEALQNPEKPGAVNNITQQIWDTRKKIDWDNMLFLILQNNYNTAAKRLGYIMEQFALNPDFTNTLFRKLADTKDVVSLDPFSDDDGQENLRWRVRVKSAPKS